MDLCTSRINFSWFKHNKNNDHDNDNDPDKPLTISIHRCLQCGRHPKRINIYANDHHFIGTFLVKGRHTITFKSSQVRPYPDEYSLKAIVSDNIICPLHVNKALALFHGDTVVASLAKQCMTCCFPPLYIT